MGLNAFYRALLRAYPREFRAEFRDDMEAAFAACVERERRRARFATLRILWRAIVDTVWYASKVRLEAHLRRSRREAAHASPIASSASYPTPKGTRMAQTIQDIRLGTRLLLKDRSFTVTVLLTLSICVGANAAIFALVHSVLLRPLPVPEADRLVNIIKSYPKAGVERTSSSVPDYYDRLEALDTMETIALYRRTGVTVGVEGGVERLMAVQATSSFFELTRTKPIVGAVFRDADTQAAVPEVIISHGLWRTQFGGRADVIGRQLRINGVPRTIVAVMPQDFRFVWADISLWTPLVFGPADRADGRRHSNNYLTVGRLKPEASLAQTQHQLDAIDRRNHERTPELRQVLDDAGFHTRAVAFQDDLVREVRPALILLWGGVLFVLLIGAVNITNLVIVRSSARHREMATRHALGAHVSRLARQILTETLLLTMLGTVLGLLLGRWALDFVPTLGLDEMPRGHEIHMAPATTIVISGLSLVVGLAVSLVPIVRLWRLDIAVVLRDEGRGGTASRRSMFLRRSLATAQIAFAFLLLVGAGLLFVSFQRVLAVSPGFGVENVIAGHVSLPRARYPNNDAARAFAERALDRLRSLPGLESVALTDSLPLGDSINDNVILAEGYVKAPGQSILSPIVSSVSDGYFETMQIALVAGRFFDVRDTTTSPTVAIVDRKLARRFWPGQDPIGKRLFTPDDDADLSKPGPGSTIYTVVGVVDDVAVLGLTEETSRVGAYYFPLRQRPTGSLAIVARTPLSAETAAQAMRSVLGSIDPELPLYDVRGMADLLDQSLLNRRIPMMLAVAFGTVALLLSSIGIYGVLAYQVAQRRREIGIRMALGSSVRAVFRVVLLDGAKIVAVGLALGVAGSLLTGRYIESQLFGVSALDPWVIGGVALLLASVSLIAVAIPARRAARVHPGVVLASE